MAYGTLSIYIFNKLKSMNTPNYNTKKKSITSPTFNFIYLYLNSTILVHWGRSPRYVIIHSWGNVLMVALALLLSYVWCWRSHDPWIYSIFNHEEDEEEEEAIYIIYIWDHILL